jgi:hypothetical protein
MSITNVNRQTATAPLPQAVQNKVVDQFSRLIQQRSGDATTLRDAKGQNTAGTSDLSKVQARRDGDQHQRDQGDHHQGMTRRVVNGQLVTMKDDHVIGRVATGSAVTKSTTGTVNTPAMTTGSDLPRIPLANSNNIPTKAFVKPSRTGETTGKALADLGTTGTTTLLNAEAAIRGQQNGGGSSGGGNQQGQNDQADNSSSGNQGGTGDDGGTTGGNGGNLPPGGRGRAAGAAPEPDDDDDISDDLDNFFSDMEGYDFAELSGDLEDATAILFRNAGMPR